MAVIYIHGFWYLVVSALLILLTHGLQAGFSDSDVVNLVGIYMYISICVHIHMYTWIRMDVEEREKER